MARHFSVHSWQLRILRAVSGTYGLLVITYTTHTHKVGKNHLKIAKEPKYDILLTLTIDKLTNICWNMAQV